MSQSTSELAHAHPNQFALLGQRRFAPFFWTQFLGAGNDNLFKFAFTVMVTYQQSNQWALETLAMTQDPIAARSREQAQAWLRVKGYTPSTLHIPAFKRLGARLTAANIAFDDHPNEKRFTGRIETVTVDSVFAWLNRSGLGGTVQVIR